MTDCSRLLALLERAADLLGIPVRYAALATEELAGRGGYCVVRGERKIIIERDLADGEKARLLAAGLAALDVDDIYLPPAVREAIERARGGPTGTSPVLPWSDGGTGNPPAPETGRSAETPDR